MMLSVAFTVPPIPVVEKMTRACLDGASNVPSLAEADTLTVLVPEPDKDETVTQSFSAPE